MLLEEKTILKKLKKGVLESFIGVFLVILFAIVLLKNPENFINVAIHIFGYGAIFLGVLNGVLFFKIKEEEMILNKRLMQSALLISFGIVAFFKTDTINSMITLILGGYFIYQNSSRLEAAAYLKKYTKKLWIYAFICSIVNLLLALILMINPFNIEKMNQFISILLISMEIILSLQNMMILIGVKNESQQV